MKIRVFFFTVIVILGMTSYQNNAYCQDNQQNEKVIVAVGSSLAKGWVTSLQNQYDMQNGYLPRMSRTLEPGAWKLINMSVPGFTTATTLEILDKEVLTLNPDCLYIGLSMANEGLDSKNPDSVYGVFKTGMQEIIQKCQEKKIPVVMGLGYANNNYGPEHYEYVKKMNLLLNSWNLPCVNLLGALNDGQGNFPEGYTWDPDHPDNRGHEELFLSMPLDIFKAAVSGKQIMTKLKMSEGVQTGKKSDIRTISYIPGSVVHSNAMVFSFKTRKKGQVCEIVSMEGSLKISIDSKGQLACQSSSGIIRNDVKVDDQQWHQLVLTHGYLSTETCLYLDGELVGSLQEQFESVEYIIGGDDYSIAFRDLLIYRASLNADEVKMLSRGVVLPASLEFASALDDKELKGHKEVTNQAYGSQAAWLNNDHSADMQADLITRIVEARKVRQKELVFADKEPIKMDPELFQQYAGKYYIAEDDYFEVLTEGGKLYFVDRGNRAELLPEAADKFFIKYPADLTVTFTRKDKAIIGLTFSMGEMEMKAKKDK